MKMYGRNLMDGAETGLEESMWQLGLGGRDSYPGRPGEPDCVYYIRTGFCGFGARCRFNHPRDRSTVDEFRPGGGEYPEREGQPVCQYFLKTGTCRFGASCKYHHPRHGGGLVGPLSLNHYGYPLRPGEKECSYYVKTGLCKFGVNCKFHHPNPAGISMPAPSPAFYPTVQSHSVSSHQYGGVASWQLAQPPPLVPSSYLQGPYAPVLISPGGMVPFPSWSPYPPSVSPVVSPGAQNIVGTAPPYGPAYPGPSLPFSSPAGLSSSSQRENTFPERPNQPECQFYMKTGDCKFGSSCRYHHPPEWVVQKENYALNSMGLPSRPDLKTNGTMGGGYERGRVYYRKCDPYTTVMPCQSIVSSLQ
ncbi:zinc finger CCCH domain-containing protein 32-like isoform X2 [Tasmannia lanceolata]|uniref:zinc finger CCCH domain-containing protein 32-like isoform X2 n=1 Tax=Tasmannia lanceolata TaxID=3420 RepID=UPI0040646A53